MFINRILEGLKTINKPQLKFLRVLFQTIFVCQSSINFSSLARHSNLNERTYRRQFQQEFDFMELNKAIVKECGGHITAFAMDASFIQKSGKATFGLDKFWNGCASRAERGLESSLISLVDGGQGISFALTVDQTAPHLSNQEEDAERKTRIDFYAAQLEKAAPQILPHTRIGLFDGYYAKLKFVRRAVQAGFVVISRLRSDAHLKYLYEGEQKPRGRKRKYDGKVDYQALSRFQTTTVKVENQEVQLFSQVVWSVSLKRPIKLVRVTYEKQTVNLFSTALDLSGEEIFWHYRSRFTIEFLLRDAKQSGGLSDCQARDNQALEFHWNSALSSVNFARAMACEEELKTGEKKPFSMKSLKQQFFNEHLLTIFISKLGLEQSGQKCQEVMTELRNYAVISS